MVQQVLQGQQVPQVQRVLQEPQDQQVLQGQQEQLVQRVLQVPQVLVVQQVPLDSQE